MSAVSESVVEGGGGPGDAVILCDGLNPCRSCAHEGKNCCAYKYREEAEGGEEYRTTVCGLMKEGRLRLLVGFCAVRCVPLVGNLLNVIGEVSFELDTLVTANVRCQKNRASIRENRGVRRQITAKTDLEEAALLEAVGTPSASLR
jgi:hypothetical protein